MILPEQKNWRWQIKNLIRTPESLGRFLGRPLPEDCSPSKEGEAPVMWVSPYYAGLIDPGDPNDPILRQILPRSDESDFPPGTSMDPLDEEAHSPLKGLVHRYPDRVLLTTTGFCPTLCRFCMRRRCWSPDHDDSRLDVEAVLAYINSHREIRDVIISGGDPLFLPPFHLRAILEGVQATPHVEIIRIGSRAPATLPMRIDEELVEMLLEFKPLWFLTHFNHPRELTAEAMAALTRLISAGAVLNNQSVLLKGVNDSASVLMDLSMKLLKVGVRPYYLHQVDFVGPASHLRVPIEEGMEIIKAMFGRISGLGIPRYVLDLPGGKGKVPLMPDFKAGREEEAWIFQAPLGGWVEVPPGGHFPGESQ